MKAKLIILSAALAVGISAAVYAVTKEPRTTETFLNQRQSVLSCVERAYAKPPFELSLKMPQKEPENLGHPGEGHIKKTENWRAHTSHRLVFDSGDNRIESGKALDFFFSGLKKHGFRSKGSHTVTSTANLEIASNAWWVETDPRIYVDGTIVTHQQSGEVVLSINIHESIKKR